VDTNVLLELITSLSGLVDLYGVTTVGMSSLLGLSIYQIFRLRKLLKNAANAGRSFSKSFPSIIRTNSEVTARLRHLKSDIQADRVLVFQYHNGSHNLNGVDFAKVSCTHEVVKPGLKTVQQELLNLPVSAYITLTECAFGKEASCLSSVTKLKAYDSSTYEMLKAHGVKSAIIKPLKDDNDHIFGFILVEFCRRYVRNFGTPELKITLPSMTERIAGMLDNSSTHDS